ncbi:MAG TPA: AmmeMemoRadiSam system protein A [Treponemataceae bacterium]|nr:AmmeMemoRadiSam system protein A [Treponemataceae bacterium]
MVEPILLSIAKAAILQFFDTLPPFDREGILQEYPHVAEKKASFVTLNSNGNLRGCIGSVIARNALIDDIYHNAQSAAFNDPRFPPLQKTELTTIDIEVSVLSQPKKCSYTDFKDLAQKIKPHVHGLILRHGLNQGTFLPQVWDKVSTPKEFLEHLSYKAGASPSIYSQNPEIYTYEVKVLSEKFDAILPL